MDHERDAGHKLLGAPVPRHPLLIACVLSALLVSLLAHAVSAEPVDFGAPSALNARVKPAGLPGAISEPLWGASGVVREPSAIALAPLYPSDPAPDPHDADWVAMALPCFSLDRAPNGLAELGGKIVIGGNFGALGTTRAEHVLAWDGATVTDIGDPRFSSVACVNWNGTLVAGSAELASGVSSYEPGAVLHWTGAAWDTLGTSNGSVSALGTYNGDLVVAGTFSVIGGVAAGGVARFDGSQWHAMGAGIPVNSREPEQLLQVGPYLYLAAIFSGSDGFFGIARWDGSLWSNVGDGLDSYTLGLATDGVDLYACGQFLKSGSLPLPGMARWDGTAWHAVGSGSPPSRIAWWGGSLYGNVLRGADRVSRFDGTNWVGTGDGITGSVSVLGVAAGKLVALGTFRPSAGAGDLDGARIFDGSTWTRLVQSWAAGMTGLDNYTKSARVVNDRLYVGGGQLFAGNASTALRVNGISAWDGASWSALAGGVTFPQLEHVGQFGSDVVAAGGFQVGTATGTARNIARWNGSAWSAVGGSGDVLPAYLEAGVEHLGSLYVGGDFHATGVSGHVARWTGTAWDFMGGGVGGGLPQQLLALESWGNLVIAGGQFTLAGGAPAANIAAWDGALWSPLGTGLNSVCNKLTLHAGELVAGGPFTLAGGQPATGAARWDGVSWHAMGTLAVEVRDFAEMSGVLYAVGRFHMPDGSIGETATRWDGVDWDLLGSGVDPSSSALIWVEGYHGDLYVGGAFSYAFGKVSSCIMRLPAANLAVGDSPVVSAVALTASPNPGRGLTAFSFALPQTGRVRLAVYDAAGRVVATLLDGEVLAGRHVMSWSGAASPGIYFARLDAPGGVRRTTRAVRIE